jgi:hypothetical protein
MTDERHDDHALAERLGELPGGDVSPRARDRIRREALRTLRRETSLTRRPALRRARRAYDRAVEPALLAAFSFGYVIWAVLSVQSILHP